MVKMNCNHGHLTPYGHLDGTKNMAAIRRPNLHTIAKGLGYAMPITHLTSGLPARFFNNNNSNHCQKYSFSFSQKSKFGKDVEFTRNVQKQKEI